MSQVAALLTEFEALVHDGLLRRLGSAFARFIGSLGASDPRVLLSCALLSELEGRGHTCLLLEELAADPCQLLGWSRERWDRLQQAAGPLPGSVPGWMQVLAACEQVWVAGMLDFNQPLVLDQDRLYLRRYWRDETLVAQAVAARAGDAIAADADQVRHWLDRLFEAPAGNEPDWQRIACAIAARGRLAIVTGGPGTGKTYTVARLLALLYGLSDQPERLRIALAAPTGKAAANLKEAIDGALAGLVGKAGPELPLAQLAARMGAATTLHALLGARPDTRAMRHHAGNPLDIDVLIVDEASMVHLEMMAALLAALPPHARLVLLGDKDQLASVEAGAVLGDLCHGAQAGQYSQESADYVRQASGQAIPAAMLGAGGELAQQTVMLRKSRRFGGPIGKLAQAVNGGDALAASACLREAEGQVLCWMEQAGQEALLRLALDGRPGAEGGYRPYLELLRAAPAGGDPGQHAEWAGRVLAAFEQFRLLCAVREGEWGVAGINQALERRIEQEGLIRRRGEWYVGRPVMVTRNDHGLGVYNGDIGIALPDPVRAASLRVVFPHGDAVKSVLATRLAQVETAYAMTVHKAQGGEYRHAAMVLPPEAALVLARELIYTGITRAREGFTLVTPAPAVLAEAIARQTVRASGLRRLLGQGR
jgi:exodeoxyribonuclease V alpha subunit